MVIPWFINSWTSAGALANQKGMTSHQNTLLFGVRIAINTLARSVQWTCENPHLLSFLDLNLHDVAFLMVFSITGRLAACSLMILFNLR